MQGSGTWRAFLNVFPSNKGCNKSDADPTFLKLKRKEFFALLNVYVDDVVWVSNRYNEAITAVEKFKNSFQTLV